MPTVKKATKKPTSKKAPVKKTTTKKVTAKKEEKVSKRVGQTGIGERKETTLAAMKTLGGKGLSHTQIAEVTKRPKGNQLRELTELGLVNTEMQEGVRGHTFSLTPEGRKVANKLK